MHTQNKPWYSFVKTKTFRMLAILFLLLIFVTKFFLFYVICGLIDFLRNKPLDSELFRKYFIGHGHVTWLLSPLNLLVDLFTLSSKPVYQLDELPEECRQEINTVINAAKQENLVQTLENKMDGISRGMIFFKWYGKDIENSIHIDTFHQKFKYVKTIGVSIFNKHKSTSRHFGPMRITLRVLYNLNPVSDEGVYIKVSDHTHYWHDNPLFIFDDTYIHQSFNNSDQMRYCMFIDIVRPSRYFHSVIEMFIQLVRLAMLKANRIFYNKWDFIK
ncbi:aspartyl/asparaginyl beta-hydroxylase domain-containing protein [soil metagenome]